MWIMDIPDDCDLTKLGVTKKEKTNNDESLGETK